MAELRQTMEEFLGKRAAFLSCLYLIFLLFAFFTSFLLYSDLVDFCFLFLFI